MKKCLICKRILVGKNKIPFCSYCVNKYGTVIAFCIGIIMCLCLIFVF